MKTNLVDNKGDPNQTEPWSVTGNSQCLVNFQQKCITYTLYSTVKLYLLR